MTEIDRLKKALAQPKPGLSVQVRMSPYPRPPQPPHIEYERSSVKAGVLVLLYERLGKTYLPLIQRTDTVLHHKGQIGFPGGQVEAGENPSQAALRETWEELGIPPERVELLGELTPLYVPPTNFCIYPAVGRLAGVPSFRPDPAEVAGVIEVSLAELAAPETLRRERWTLRGESLTVPFYAVGPHKIWGATAMILAEFLSIAAGPD
jgi:8-oxo-dGTP pyrophosphatase MutT (NUDIX family)